MFKTPADIIKLQIGNLNTRKRQVADIGYFSPNEIEIEQSKIDDRIRKLQTKLDQLTSYTNTEKQPLNAIR